MKTQPNASQDRACSVPAGSRGPARVALRALPGPVGFSVQDKDNELFVSDVGITPRLSAEQYGDIYEDITKTLAALLDERPEVCELLRARTFARVLH